MQSSWPGIGLTTFHDGLVPSSVHDGSPVRPQTLLPRQQTSHINQQTATTPRMHLRAEFEDLARPLRFCLLWACIPSSPLSPLAARQLVVDGRRSGQSPPVGHSQSHFRHKCAQSHSRRDLSGHLMRASVCVCVCVCVVCVRLWV